MEELISLYRIDRSACLLDYLVIDGNCGCRRCEEEEEEEVANTFWHRTVLLRIMDENKGY